MLAHALRELARRAADQRRELRAVLARHAAGRSRHRDGRQWRADGSDRDCDAAHALVVLLVVDGVAALADLLQRAAQRLVVDDRVRRVGTEVEPVEERVTPRGGQRGEERLAGSGRVQRHAVADLREQADDLLARHRLDVHGGDVVERSVFQIVTAHREGLIRREALQSQAQARAEVDRLSARIEEQLPMLANREIDVSGLVRFLSAQIREENVVGVRVPALVSVECVVQPYSMLAKPHWVDVLVERLKQAVEAHTQVQVAAERVRRLDRAVRRTTQRVNLFEKILIPDAKKNIRTIQIFLGDAERAATVRSKLAKAKHQGQQQAFADVGGTA